MEDGPQGTIKVALKYHPKTRRPAITEMQRMSKPGLRTYRGANDLPRILNGLGISILSTSQRRDDGQGSQAHERGRRGPLCTCINPSKENRPCPELEKRP